MDGSMAAVLLAAVLAALLPAAWWVALRPRKIIRGPSGRQVEASDIERLLSPIVAMASGRSGGRERLLRQLEWARIDWFTPETWSLLKILTGPVAGFGSLLVFLTIGASTMLALILAVCAGATGFLYPRVYMNGRLNRRQASIARDVPVFLNLYARTAVVVRDTTAILEAIAALVARESASRVGVEGVTPRSRRHTNPYSSDLWLGLELMLKQRALGVYRRGATLTNPDALIGFSVFCNDPDLNTWVDRVRQAREAQRHLSPEQADILVANLQQRRLWQVRRSFARLQARATVVLVAVNMPLLLACILTPVIVVAISGFKK